MIAHSPLVQNQLAAFTLFVSQATLVIAPQYEQCAVIKEHEMASSLHDRNAPHDTSGHVMVSRVIVCHVTLFHVTLQADTMLP